MPSNFPDAPALNQGHVAGTSSFVWKGRSWDRGPAGVIVPPPTLTSLNPISTPVSTSVMVTATGTNFTATSVVNFGAFASPTTFVSATSLTCTAPPNPTAEILQVTVVDGPQTSNALPFEWTPVVVPTLISLVPNNCEVYQTPAVVVNGTNFTPTSLVRFGATTIPPTFVSATVLNITAPSSPTVKTVQVTVIDGTQTSNALPFNYTASTGPTITSLDPPETYVNTTPTVTINGTNYIPTSVARFDGTGQTTSYVSATQLRVTAPTSPSVKTSYVSVANGAVVSNAMPFNYLPAYIPLSITGVSPSYMLIDGAAKEITVTGTGYTPACWLQVDYVTVTSTYVSPTQMKFTAAGSTTVKTINIRIGDGITTSNIWPLNYVKSVTVTSISPTTTAATSTGTLINVYGTGFDATTGIMLNSAPPAQSGAYYGGTVHSSTHMSTTIVTWGHYTPVYINAFGSLSPDQVLTITGNP